MKYYLRLSQTSCGFLLRSGNVIYRLMNLRRGQSPPGNGQRGIRTTFIWNQQSTQNQESNAANNLTEVKLHNSYNFSNLKSTIRHTEKNCITVAVPRLSRKTPAMKQINISVQKHRSNALTDVDEFQNVIQFVKHDNQLM